MSILTYFKATACGLLLALTLCGCGQGDSAEAQRTVNDRTYMVKRGNFAIPIRLQGELSSIKEHEFRFNVSKGGRNLTFTYVLPDRSVVKKGDVVFRVSDEWFINEQKRLEQELQDSMRDRDQAEQDLMSLRSEITSQVKKVATTLRNAQEALTKYNAQEAPDKKKQLLNTINEKVVAVDSAAAELFKAQLDLTAAYSSDDENAVELAKKRIVEKESTLANADNNRMSAVESLRNFRRYEHKNKLEALRESLSQAALGVKKEMVGIRVKFAKKEIALAAFDKKIERFNKDLKIIKEIFPKLEMRAPVDGMLFLNNDSWRYRENGGLKAGTEVDQGALLAKIPDLSKFSVGVNVPEEFRALLKEGLPAYIRTKAVPDLVLGGKVKEIAGASRNLVEWDSSTPKVYATEISTDTSDSRLTPGMSVNVEILADEVKDACFVPIEAVYNRDGKTMVKRLTAGSDAVKEVEVSCARSSVDFVEIDKGIEPGDIILLNRE